MATGSTEMKGKKKKVSFGTFAAGCIIVWFIFLIFHLLLTGKIYLWNFMGNIPSVCFVFFPLCALVYELLRKQKRLFFVILSLIALLLGFTQFDLNLFRLKTEETNTTEFNYFLTLLI